MSGACLFLCAALGARADSGPALEPPSALKSMSLEQLFDLEVSTVSQKAETLSKTAAAVHVVTHEDLRRSGVLSLPEALRCIPGVEVARVDSRQYAITARGFNGTIANKLLVLIDGRSVYTPLYSGVFWDEQDVFLEDVEQIEVIRGPGATVWGANAVNGVINVISKDASRTQGLLLAGGSGSEERGFGGLRYGGTFGAHGSFRIYGKPFDRDASLSANGTEAGDDFRMNQGGFRADWSPSSATRFTVQGDAYGGSVQQPNVQPTDLAGGNVRLQWARQSSQGTELELGGYFDRTDRDIPASFGEVLDTYDLHLRHRIGALPRNDLVWGLGYRVTRDDVQNSSGFAFLPALLTRQLFTCFLQDEIALGDGVRLTVGSKLEHNEYTGFEVQPSARMLWTPAADHTLWAAASRAVRTPSRIDRDFFVPATPPYLLAGGPDFDSEVLNAYELGYKTRPLPFVTASVAGFYNVYDRLRSLETTTPIVLANGLEGDTYGAEGEASLQASERWRLGAGVTLLRMELRRKPGSTDQGMVQQAGDSPCRQFYARSSASLPHAVELDLTVRHVGELPNQKVPAYTTGDARLAWRPIDALELSVVGLNLFQPHHAEFGAPAARREVERSVYGKVSCHL